MGPGTGSSRLVPSGKGAIVGQAAPAGHAL